MHQKMVCRRRQKRYAEEDKDTRRNTLEIFYDMNAIGCIKINIYRWNKNSVNRLKYFNGIKTLHKHNSQSLMNNDIY